MYGGGVSDIRDLTERSTGPTEPNRSPSIYDPISFSGPITPNSLRGWSVENTGISAQEWIQLLNDYLRGYYEEQDPAGDFDDMDRIYRQQESKELKELFDRFANGEATVDELASFEIDYLRDVDGVSDWWDKTVSIAEADRIIATLETDPSELENIPTPT